jgi:hypothetical protein
MLIPIQTFEEHLRGHTGSFIFAAKVMGSVEGYD